MFETSLEQKKGIPKGANANGESEFRDMPTSPIVKDRLVSVVESILGKETLSTALEGKMSLTFSEAVSIHA